MKKKPVNWNKRYEELCGVMWESILRVDTLSASRVGFLQQRVDTLSASRVGFLQQRVDTLSASRVGFLQQRVDTLSASRVGFLQQRVDTLSASRVGFLQQRVDTLSASRVGLLQQRVDTIKQHWQILMKDCRTFWFSLEYKTIEIEYFKIEWTAEKAWEHQEMKCFGVVDVILFETQKSFLALNWEYMNIWIEIWHL